MNKLIEQEKQIKKQNRDIAAINTQLQSMEKVTKEVNGI